LSHQNIKGFFKLTKVKFLWYDTQALFGC